MLDQPLGVPPRFWRAVNHLRTALALGCTTLALVGCGGGSGDTTPPSPPPSALAAPANFTVNNLDPFDTFAPHIFGIFWWNATLGATRYELYVDPDGTGPLPETKADDYNEASGTGFSWGARDQGFQGSLYSAVTASSLAASLNSTYRLRACDASGCGAFTDSKAVDIVNSVSHEFASGRVPLKSSAAIYRDNPRLTKDGLTLAIPAPSDDSDSAVYVFTRSSSAQPWQQPALLRSGKANFGWRIALSADGSTLAVGANEPASSAPNSNRVVVYLYQRNGSTWNQQAFLEAPSAPSACPQCGGGFGTSLALSADGNLLAVPVNYHGPSVDAISMSGVTTYARTGATWAPQAYVETGSQGVSSMALSSDGNTLAVSDGGYFQLPATGNPLASVLVFAQKGNGTWSQQARIPAWIISAHTMQGAASTMALSSDGNTLAVHARTEPEDFSCGSFAARAWAIALYARTGTTWQRQTAISRGIAGNWALASDGNALFYGNELFTRNNGAWACP